MNSRPNAPDNTSQRAVASTEERNSGNGSMLVASRGHCAGDIGKSIDEKMAQAENGQIDKTNLPISAPRRVRDKEHLRYVASQPCIICGRSPGHAHHLRFAQPRALGRKVSDEWTVPLCLIHHRAVHSVGSEQQWWAENSIDPIAHAIRLWWHTRHGGLEQKMEAPEKSLSYLKGG